MLGFVEHNTLPISIGGRAVWGYSEYREMIEEEIRLYILLSHTLGGTANCTDTFYDYGKFYPLLHFDCYTQRKR